MQAPPFVINCLIHAKNHMEFHLFHLKKEVLGIRCRIIYSSSMNRMSKMKVGLLRHFKVTLGYPNKLVSSAELLQWQREYDESGLEEINIDLHGVEWKRCYSSDLGRARQTAEKAFSGHIFCSEDLREIAISPILKSGVKIPLWLYLSMIRTAWFFGHESQKESKKQVLERINKALDYALAHGEDVLIVGHGGIMMFMRKELLKRGFSGPKLNRPENARIYIFEK